ncbi:hypothetical protein [Actinoplanes sp. NPDC020271]|uniref:hypothetical protein n=1 Tax=Actinoplanes sp. NPDC020271 TaxID=3363896 RepID=UPI0037A0B168
MARGTVHAPKPDEQRRRRNAPTHDETVLPRDEEVRGPELAELTYRPATAKAPPRNDLGEGLSLYLR